MGVAVLVGATRVLITGCNGFIGRSLAKHLLSIGCRVRGTIRRAGSADALPPGTQPVVVPDIGPETDWRSALDGIDIVIHLAARVQQEKGRAGTLDSEYFRINADGSARLARSCADNGVNRLIFASTVKVIGEGACRPYTENDPENPHGAYAESKLAAERALMRISARSELEAVILRPPLVYGPGVKANFLKLIRLVEKQIPLPLAGVANRRSLLFIDNLIEVIALCMQHPSAEGQTFLVADDEYLSTPELIREMAGQIGVSSRLFACPLFILRPAAALIGRAPEMRRLLGSLYLDTRKIQHKLQWHPRFSTQAGIAATLADYQRGAASARKK